MPPPFWTPERRRHYVDLYGGIDSPGYQQNVLGNWGDPEMVVFPHQKLILCAHPVPQYVRVKMLFDAGEREIHVSAWRANPTYSPAKRATEEDERLEALLPFYEETFAAANFEEVSLLRKLFSPPSVLEAAQLVAGADFGASDDPTEIFVNQVGRRTRWIARLHLKRFDYDLQKRIVDALDDIYEPSLGWGADAGNAGRAVIDILHGDPGHHRWDERLSGYVFNSKIDAVDPKTGDPILDPVSQKPQRVSLKEFSTSLLELDMQRQEMELPYDTEVIDQFVSHTYRRGAAGERIFAKKNDHTIDAQRVARLRVWEMDRGLSTGEVVFHRVEGSRRSSMDYGGLA